MPARPFLITGMPRCRQAWLSVLMTTGNSLCYYDPALGFTDIADLKALYESDFYKHVGVADSSMSFFLPWILENIRPATVIIDRDPEAIAASNYRVGNPVTNLPDLAREAILPFKDHPLVKWVPYEGLKHKRVVENIFWHLMPGEPFDEGRYEQLLKMHIGHNLQESVAAYNRRRPQLDHFLRDVLPRVKVLERHHETSNLH